MASRFWTVAVLGAIAALPSCFNSGSSSGTATSNSLVAIDPNDFLSAPYTDAGADGSNDSGTGDAAADDGGADASDSDASTGSTPLSCGTGPGQMQKYVATFFDVTPDAAALSNPLTTPPESCNRVVVAGTTGDNTSPILLGHQYIAEIDGYDRSDIEPDPADARKMKAKLPDGGAVDVDPRWVIRCEQAAECVQYYTQYIRGCTVIVHP